MLILHKRIFRHTWVRNWKTCAFTHLKRPQIRHSSNLNKLFCLSRSEYDGAVPFCLSENKIPGEPLEPQSCYLEFNDIDIISANLI